MRAQGYGPNGYKVTLSARDMLHALETLALILGIVAYVHIRDKVQKT